MHRNSTTQVQRIKNLVPEIEAMRKADRAANGGKKPTKVIDGKPHVKMYGWHIDDTGIEVASSIWCPVSATKVKPLRICTR